MPVPVPVSFVPVFSLRVEPFVPEPGFVMALPLREVPVVWFESPVPALVFFGGVLVPGPDPSLPPLRSPVPEPGGCVFWSGSAPLPGPILRHPEILRHSVGRISSFGLRIGRMPTPPLLVPRISDGLSHIACMPGFEIDHYAGGLDVVFLSGLVVAGP